MTDNLRACLLMVATMAGFAVEDVFLKLGAQSVPVGEILLLLGIGGTAVMAALVRARRQRFWAPELASPPFVIRTVCEAGGMMLGTTALAVLPLSLVTAVGQSGPILATIGAALFLGETVGWRRWTAVLVGLAGVLLIVKPGAMGFQPQVLLSVLAVCCIAARDLATRRVPAGLTTLELNFWGYAMTIPSGVVLMAVSGDPWVWPSAFAWICIGITQVLGVTFYYTLTLALRLGESSVVVPFRYSRIVFALVLAALVFDERPDLAMIAGMVLVTLSGLYTILREARLRRRPRLQASPDPVAPL
jgi:drug/metabolite transporter (DMT)-like permease